MERTTLTIKETIFSEVSSENDGDQWRQHFSRSREGEILTFLSYQTVKVKDTFCFKDSFLELSKNIAI